MNNLERCLMTIFPPRIRFFVLWRSNVFDLSAYFSTFWETVPRSRRAAGSPRGVLRVRASMSSTTKRVRNNTGPIRDPLLGMKLSHWSVLLVSDWLSPIRSNITIAICGWREESSDFWIVLKVVVHYAQRSSRFEVWTLKQTVPNVSSSLFSK